MTNSIFSVGRYNGPLFQCLITQLHVQPSLVCSVSIDKRELKLFLIMFAYLIRHAHWKFSKDVVRYWPFVGIWMFVRVMRDWLPGIWPCSFRFFVHLAAKCVDDIREMNAEEMAEMIHWQKQEVWPQICKFQSTENLCKCRRLRNLKWTG